VDLIKVMASGGFATPETEQVLVIYLARSRVVVRVRAADNSADMDDRLDPPALGRVL
jgi:hypothetical protein